MPITKSAKKSLKVSKTKQSQNKINEVKLAKALRTVTKENVSEVISLIDRAVKTGLMHQNKAARVKSELTKKFGTPKKAKKAQTSVKKSKAAPKKVKTKVTKKTTKK